MLKKIYSLLASILLLSACTADDMMQEKNPSDDSKVTLSFQVDVPSAAVITKSTDVPTNEVGIEKLRLVTFDGSNIKIETVSASLTSGNTYSAVVSKETRRIQFVANYDGYESINSVTDASTASTNEYVFFKEMNVADGATTLGTVELLRNWSKISLTDNSGKLTDVQFMVYNASTKATVAPGSGNVNIPSGNTLMTDQSFKSAGTDIHTFEQLTSGNTPAFVIVKAKFNGEETYYKLDLAVTNPATGIVNNYDIMRNYWYKITISDVQRKGVSWAEVIKPGKIADNNITASTELDKYPSIAFGDEKLEVTKTTFVFTAAGALDMLATYTKNGTAQYSGLSLVQDADETSDVVNGDVSMTQEGSSGRIRATIKAPSTEEKRAIFYVKGGNLQRKITLILRNPYAFEDVHFYNTSNVNANYTDGTTNKVTQGPDHSVWLGFSIPENVDASIFPLECKVRTTTLYAVTEGVRIETDPADDKVYYYVYTAKAAGRHSIQFKTNSTTAGETATLSAEYMSNATAAYVTDAPLLINGTAKYGSTGTTNPTNISGTVYYTINGDRKSFSVSRGSYSNVSLSKGLSDGTSVTFTYTTNGITYTSTTTVGLWKSNPNIVLTADVITGTARYYRSSSWRDIDATISWSSGRKSGSFSSNSGDYAIVYPELDDTDVITFTYTRQSVDYKASMTVAEWKANTDLKLFPKTVTGAIQTGYYSGFWGNWNGTDVPQNSNVTCSIGNMQITSKGKYTYTVDKVVDQVTITYNGYSNTVDIEDLVDGQIRLTK